MEDLQQNNLRAEVNLLYSPWFGVPRFPGVTDNASQFLYWECIHYQLTEFDTSPNSIGRFRDNLNLRNTLGAGLQKHRHPLASDGSGANR